MALAWLPALCDEADAEPRFLGCEDFGEQGARPADDARSASGRMAGHPDLGVRADRQKAGGGGFWVEGGKEPPSVGIVGSEGASGLLLRRSRDQAMDDANLQFFIVGS